MKNFGGVMTKKEVLALEALECLLKTVDRSLIHTWEFSEGIFIKGVIDNIAKMEVSRHYVEKEVTFWKYFKKTVPAMEDYIEGYVKVGDITHHFSIFQEDPLYPKYLGIIQSVKKQALAYWEEESLNNLETFLKEECNA
jgi:hypothetical protein